MTTTTPSKSTALAIAPQETLPAVSVRVDGQLAIVSNLKAFGAALREFIGRIPKEPGTDQDFADTEAACKRLKRAEDELESAKEHALAQLADVNAMRQIVKEYRELARTTRLQLEKLVALRKEQIRGDIVAGGQKALAEHIAALNARLGQNLMPTVNADFGGVIKNRRTIQSLQDAVNGELARAKIAASEIADRIQINLATLRERKELAFLFPDVAALIQKQPDDLRAVFTARIAEHDAKERARLEAERERIAAEERAKAEAAAHAYMQRQRAAEEAERSQREEAERASAAKPVQPAVNVAPPVATALTPAAPAATGIATTAEIGAAAPSEAGFGSAASNDATAPSGPPTLRLGQINERLAPIALTADGLASLGFPPAAHDKASKLYHELDFIAICGAIVVHVSQLSRDHMQKLEAA